MLFRSLLSEEDVDAVGAVEKYSVGLLLQADEECESLAVLEAEDKIESAAPFVAPHTELEVTGLIDADGDLLAGLGVAEHDDEDDDEEELLLGDELPGFDTITFELPVL